MCCSGIIQKYFCTSEMCSHFFLYLCVNAGMDVFVAGPFSKYGELEAFLLSFFL